MGYRHKEVTYLDWETDTFEELIDNGYVDYEYKYSMIKKAHAGKVFKVKTKYETFFAIASNIGVRVYRQGWKRRNKTDYRIMYRLTKEGYEHIKELIVEQRMNELNI